MVLSQMKIQELHQMIKTHQGMTIAAKGMIHHIIDHKFKI